MGLLAFGISAKCPTHFLSGSCIFASLLLDGSGGVLAIDGTIDLVRPPIKHLQYTR